MSEKVKQRCTELMYGWSQVLPHEPKIKEAYQMLRRQGIIKQDPVHINRVKKIHSYRNSASIEKSWCDKKCL
jgi:hypothetical protein